MKPYCKFFKCKKINTIFLLKKQPLNNFDFDSKYIGDDLRYYYCKTHNTVFKRKLKNSEKNYIYNVQNNYNKQLPEKEIKKFNFIRRNIPKKINKVLEIGAGSLHLFEYLNKQSIIDKYEIIDFMMTQNSYHNLKIISKDFEKFETEHKYDLIIARHVLEHMNDVNLFFKKLKRLSRKNTIYIIETPTSDKILNNNSLRPFMHQHIHFLPINMVPMLLNKKLRNISGNTTESSSLMILKDKNTETKFNNNNIDYSEIFKANLKIKIQLLERFIDSNKRIVIYGLSSYIHIIKNFINFDNAVILDQDINKVGKKFFYNTKSYLIIKKLNANYFNKKYKFIILTADNNKIKEKLKSKSISFFCP